VTKVVEKWLVEQDGGPPLYVEVPGGISAPELEMLYPGATIVPWEVARRAAKYRVMCATVTLDEVTPEDDRPQAPEPSRIVLLN
jgi:hypothetical protein